MNIFQVYYHPSLLRLLGSAPCFNNYSDIVLADIQSLEKILKTICKGVFLSKSNSLGSNPEFKNFIVNSEFNF